MKTIRLIIFGALALTAHAHPGGLNSDGGHTKSETGEYHVHRTPASESKKKSEPEEVSGRVVSVHDGDTLTLLIRGTRELKIRLEGIDAPETNQAYGARAKQALSEFVFEKDIVARITSIDRYGRSIGRVFLGNVDVNLNMVHDGFAWCYEAYAKNDESLRLAEQHARSAEAGLWTSSDPQAPWDFRKSRRN